MLKRLLTAVLVLGLIMAFSGTAFTAPTDMPGDKDYRKITGGPAPADAIRILTKTVTGPADIGTRLAAPQHPPMPAPMSPDTTTCDVTDYADFVDGNANIFSRTNAHATQSGFAERFDGPNKPGFPIMVNGAHAWLYRVAQATADSDELVNLKVNVYSDLAG